VIYLQMEEVNREKVYPMHQTSVDGVEDMSTLAELHEAAIMHNLHLRYQKDCIYTNIGSILAAVNPYKQIADLYDPDAVELYSQHHLGELPPHIFAVANECYRCLWKRHDSQCVLISGESGAGKTESTKLLLQFLSVMSQNSAGTPPSERSTRVEQAIVQSSPIMEAFGNAKTVYNNNSSRFGKFIQLHFSQNGNIQGGSIIDCILLTVWRVRTRGRGTITSSMHCLQVLTRIRRMYFLEEPECYYYLSQSGCVKDRSLDDKQLFDSVMEALKVMEFTEEEIRDVFKLLSGVLQLGNIEFMTAGGAQIVTKGVVSIVSDLLGLDSFQLSEVLTQRSMILRGEEICSPLTVEQAVDSRDSVAMALYSQCFSWIIMKINQKIKGKDNFKSIGILDIFGFENFEVNRFEQFNINYANEKLQEYFNKHIFSLEQLEYNREGVHWDAIDWMDNAECLDLIEKTNPYYVKPRVTDHQFGIKHYAGEVLYDVRGILEKNRDTFRDDILNMLKDSRLDFIYDLFERVGSRSSEETLKMGTARRKPTVSSQFRNPNKFDPEVVLNQLRYSGMLETVKVRRAGFPVRRTFKDFCSRYKVILKDKASTGDDKKRCTDLLMAHDRAKKEWQMGKTKVFLKEALEQRLEKERDEVRRKAGMVIRAHILSYVARKHYKRVLSSIITIQKNYRAHYWRRVFLRLRSATLVFQKHRRGQLARSHCHRLREEKRKREEEDDRRRREEAERLQCLEQEKLVLKRQQEETQQREAAVEKKPSAAGAGEPRYSTNVRISLTRSPSPHTTEEERRQMEEILRLEREIEQLQKQREDGVSQLCESSRAELQQRRDAEIRRLRGEASRVATQFLDMLDFGALEPSTSSEENVQDISKTTGPSALEDVDEGLRAKDGRIPLPDFPPPAEGPVDQEMFNNLPPPPPAFAEGMVSPVPAAANISLALNPPATSDTPTPPPPLPPATAAKEDEGPDYETIDHVPPEGLPDSEEPIYSNPPDVDSDYDHDEFDEAQGSSGDAGSTNDGHMTDEEVLRKSTCTNHSQDSYRGSSDSFIDSDDDNDGYVDTDEEVSNGRVNLLNGNGPPYFHSYLYMKGKESCTLVPSVPILLSESKPSSLLQL
ncbi:hypothetical protein Z043_111247, partial [Scleropages formosus]